MTLRTMFAGLCLLSLTTLAAAQDKISGSAQCGKPDVQQQVDVSDHPGHSISIMQMKCTWTKPMEVAGVQDKDGTDSGMADLHAGAGTSHGYYVDNMANGPKTGALPLMWTGNTVCRKVNTAGRVRAPAPTLSSILPGSRWNQ